jgi:tetratricopeptide (TPR) repeat protein
MNKQRVYSLLCSLSFLLAGSLGMPLRAADFDRIGSFDFPTSASGEVQQHFLLGVGYLHSFGMVQAQDEFKRAQELDPDFAMAYWGEVFTYQHPFFGAIDDRPGQALERLGPTTEARLAKAPTAREKGFLLAAEAYALTPGDMGDRRIAWMNAMEDLYEQFPEDDEVKAFYTVAMLAGATASGPMRDRLNMRAGALAMELFKKNDNHPGAAHYVIHAFDDPIHAPIALEAARKYATIAPAVSHARHMPTHIFIQHGMWDEVAEWNDSAYLVADEQWKPGDYTDPQDHASDWGQYGDLQRGDAQRSLEWLARAEHTLRNNPDSDRALGTLRTMQARHVIETRDWQVPALTDQLRADELLALGLSAASEKYADLALAEQVAARLEELAKGSPNNASLSVSHAEVAAAARLLRASQSQGSAAQALRDEARQLLDAAVALTERGRLPNGAANPLKPVHEFYGEILIELGDHAKAAQLFEESLLRTPNRPWSLLGAARAHAGLGHDRVAAERYTTLLAVWKDDGHPIAREAMNFLGR